MSNTENNAICSELTPLHINGMKINRLMIILRTNGCSYAKAAGGCVHCSLIDNADDKMATPNLIKQFETEIKKYDIADYDHLDLLTLGSFFDEEEVPDEFLEYVFTFLETKTDIYSVLVESRPEYITEEKLQKSISILKKVRLEVGIGVESTSEYVREVLLKKGYNMDDVEHSLKLMSKYNVSLSAYVLHKPVGLTEKQAIEDSISTITTIFKLGKKYNLSVRVALQPYYIARNSYSYSEFKKGNYRTPTFWSIIEVLKKTNQLGDIFVALNDEGLSDRLTASNCPKCDSRVLKALNQYNYTNDLNELLEISCSCKNNWLRMCNKEKNISTILRW